MCLASPAKIVNATPVEYLSDVSEPNRDELSKVFPSYHTARASVRPDPGGQSRPQEPRRTDQSATQRPSLLGDPSQPPEMLWESSPRQESYMVNKFFPQV